MIYIHICIYIYICIYMYIDVIKHGGVDAYGDCSTRLKSWRIFRDPKDDPTSS